MTTETIDVKKLALNMIGFSGADISNMVNQAALNAASEGKKSVGVVDLNAALNRARSGKEQKNKKYSEFNINIITANQVSTIQIRLHNYWYCMKSQVLQVKQQGAKPVGSFQNRWMVKLPVNTMSHWMLLKVISVNQSNENCNDKFFSEEIILDVIVTWAHILSELKITSFSP